MMKKSKTKDSAIPVSVLDPSSVDCSSPWAVRCAGALLLLSTFAVFWNGLAGVFVLDDHILSQPLSFALTAWPMGEAVTSSGIAGRPVLSISFALNRILIGSAPWHFRIVNIAIHAAAGLLLFGLVRRALQHCGMRNVRCGTLEAESRNQSAIQNPQLGIGIAFAASLLWLVHPLQTQSVTYIIQRAESLSGFFLLLTLYAAVRRFDGGGSAWAILAVAACILGMGVKQTMFAAPALVLLYDYTFVSDSLRSALRLRPGLYAGLAFGWVLLGVLIVVWQSNDSFPELGARNPWPYALSQPGVILYYLWLSFWPDVVVADYAWPYAHTAWQIVPPLLAVGSLACLTLWGIWRRSWLGFLGAWFFLILAPSSSFAALEQVIQCHRMYLPLAAVSVLAVAGVSTTLARIVPLAGGGARLTRVAGVFMLAFAATALAWGTIRRNMIYGDELAFWQENVSKQPASRFAHSALGSEFMIRKQMAEADACFRKALAVKDSPMPVEAHYRLGLILLGSRRFDEALTQFQAAHALRPYHAGTVEKMGAALAAQGHFPEALRHLEKALTMGSDPVVAAAAHNNIGTILSSQGHWVEAAAHYRLATQLQPNLPEAFGNLGSTLVLMGRFEEALVPYDSAVRLEPKNADFHNNLGFALLSLKSHDKAVLHFREALRINPNHALARRNLQTAIAADKSSNAPPPGTGPDKRSTSEFFLP